MFEYGTAILGIVLAAAGLWDAFYAKDRSRRIIISLILLLTTAFTVFNIHKGAQQHDQDEGKIEALQSAIERANQTQQRNAEQFLRGQDDSRREFLQQFNDLSSKVATYKPKPPLKSYESKQPHFRQSLEIRGKLLSSQRRAWYSPSPPMARHRFTSLFLSRTILSMFGLSL